MMRIFSKLQNKCIDTMRRHFLLIFCLYGTVSVSTTPPSPSSSTKPSIAIDEERRALGQSKLRELERHSESSPCWKDAVSQLDASCKDLTDMQQSRLAVAFANCHLAKSARQTYPCTDSMTIEECTRDMDPVSFQTYTEFFTHTGHICYFLQSQLWQERTENVISRLSDSSKEALDKLEEGLEYHKAIDTKQNEALKNQDKILDQDRKIAESLHKTSEHMNEAFTDMRLMAENQRALLSEVFGTLQRSIESVRYLMSLFLVEFVGYETFAFFIVYWLVIIFLPRFGYSRFKLHLVLFADLVIEIVCRRVYGYFVFVEAKPAPESLNTLHSWLWNVRYLSLIGGVVVYVWEWRTYRDYELRNVKSLEKLQRQMKRLMQYYGLDTTEIPEGAYGGPPPPPPVSGRRASDGVVGHQQPLVDPTPPRRSLPTRVDGRQSGGFQAAYPLQMQSVPAPMPSPVISSSVSGGYGLMRIDSDSELEAVSEIEEVDIQDDDGKYGRGGVGQKVKRFLFHQPVSRREGSREPSQQPEINELYEKIEGPSLSIGTGSGTVHATSTIRHYVSRPSPRPVISVDTIDTDDLTDTCSTLPPDSDSDTDTFAPSEDPMVRQPIRVRGASSSPASVKNKNKSTNAVSGTEKKKRDPQIAGHGGSRRSRPTSRRSQLDRIEENDLANLPPSNLPPDFGREKGVSEEKRLPSDNESHLHSTTSRPPRPSGRGRRGRGQRSRRSEPVSSTTASLNSPTAGSGHDTSETVASSATSSRSNRRRRTIQNEPPSTPQTRYNLRVRTPLQRSSFHE